MLAKQQSKTPIIRGGAMIMEGGELTSLETKKLLKASYEPDKLDLEGWQLDKELSSGKNNVFTKINSNMAVVSVAGTSDLKDWYYNTVYAVGGNKAYKKTQRFKSAKIVYDKAVNKYGKENITLLGHSQGGMAVSLLGSNENDDIITYNRATAPGVKNVTKTNQSDIRTKNDLVSAFNSKGLNEEKAKSKWNINPVFNHSVNRLKKKN